MSTHVWALEAGGSLSSRTASTVQTLSQKNPKDKTNKQTNKQNPTILEETGSKGKTTTTMTTKQTNTNKFSFGSECTWIQPPGMGRGPSSTTQSLPSINEALISSLALNKTQPGGRDRDQEKLPWFTAEPPVCDVD
jgi:hypothetical protein|uniref:Uncharacterized protein n=1 Tax=Mus musculus TaxID=10090 RepID=Q3T983_MOUSE|nr:unnamed protein product [Mus musculus]